MTHGNRRWLQRLRTTAGDAGTHLRMGIVVGILAAGALAGCQDDKGEGGAASRTAESASTDREPPKAKEDAGLGVPGTGADALKDFGREPSAADAVAIDALVRRVTIALAQREPERVCSLFTSRLKEEYVKSPSETKGAACRRAYKEHMAKFSDADRRGLQQAKVTKIRVKGDGNALAVFTMPGPRWTMQPVQREGNVWKIGQYGEWSRTESAR